MRREGARTWRGASGVGWEGWEIRTSASYGVSVSNSGIHISSCEKNAVPVIRWRTGAGEFGEGLRWQGNLCFRDVWRGHK